jgi:hypothetical protein
LVLRRRKTDGHAHTSVHEGHQKIDNDDDDENDDDGDNDDDDDNDDHEESNSA